MASFKQSDMQYTYRWTARPEDNPNFRRGSDYMNFNRSEGYEVLYVINHYIETRNRDTVSNGKKAETLIHDKLPSHVFTHSELYKWIDLNW